MIDSVTKVLCGLVRVVMGMPANSVRPADQIMPAGGQTKEFATVKVISTTDAGRANLSLTELADVTTEHNDVPEKLVASVHFFRSPSADAAGIARYSNAAFDRATRLGQRLQMSAYAALMRSHGIALLAIGAARNLTAVVDATFESRGQIDLTFSVMNRESAIVPTILTVPLALSVQSSDGIETRTTEVTP